MLTVLCARKEGKYKSKHIHRKEEGKIIIGECMLSTQLRAFRLPVSYCKA